MSAPPFSPSDGGFPSQRSEKIAIFRKFCGFYWLLAFDMVNFIQSSVMPSGINNARADDSCGRCFFFFGILVAFIDFFKKYGILYKKTDETAKHRSSGWYPLGLSSFLLYDLSGLLLLTFGKSGFILSIGDKIDRLPITVREYRTSLISFLFVFGFFQKTWHSPCHVLY